MSQINEVVKRLKKKYPHRKTTFLNYNNALEVMVSTILSAQCTDERVNKVTKSLFKKYKKPQDYINATQNELREDIKSISYPNSKARNIKKACQRILDEYGGKVPEKMEDLVTLAGVGRKTANIVQSEAYGKVEGMAVDTHVKRVSYRLGLTKHKDPVKIEKDLIENVPKKEWRALSVRLIQHGRDTCDARKPHCSRCIFNDICPKNGVTVRD